MHAPVELLDGRFTSRAFLHEPCCCEVSVWLCHSCGQSRQTTDTTYQRVWRWRTRYSTYLGGLGTGIGEGNEGVKCGRDRNCLAVREVEVEVDCEAQDLAAHVGEIVGAMGKMKINDGDEDDDSYNYNNNSNNTQLKDHQEGNVESHQLVDGSDGSDGSGSGSDASTGVNGNMNINGMMMVKGDDHREKSETGYLRQEMEGIGGVVKKKLKTRVRVGAVVDEHEDEREHADYLAREIRGDERSWCGWCDRVIPSRRDVEEMNE